MTSLVPSDARARLAYKLYDLPLPCRRSYNAYLNHVRVPSDKRGLQILRDLRDMLGMSLMAKANQSRGQYSEKWSSVRLFEDIYRSWVRTDHSGLCL